jgi:hypothetical protein
MSTVLHILPGVACGALMCVPMTIGMARGWLRRRRRTPGGPAAQPPKPLAALLRR